MKNYTDLNLQEEKKILKNSKFSKLLLYVAIFSILAIISLCIVKDQAMELVLFATFLLMVVIYNLYYLKENEKTILQAKVKNDLLIGSLKTDGEFSVILNKDGLVVHADSWFYKRYGVQKGVGFNVFQAFSEDGNIIKSDLEILKKAVENVKSEQIPVRLVDKGNKIRPFTLILEPIFLTQQKKKDTKTLQLAKEPMQDFSGYFLLKASNHLIAEEEAEGLDEFLVGAYILNEENEFIYINRVLEEILKIDRDSFIENKKTLSNIILSKSQGKKLSAKRSSWQNELSLELSDGNKIHAFVSQTVLSNPEGNIVEKHGVVIKLPEEKESIKDKNEYFEKFSGTVLESSPIATIILDTEGMVLRKNPAFDDFVQEKNSSNISFLDIIAMNNRNEVAQILHDIVVGNYFEIKPFDVSIAGKKDMVATVYIRGIKNKYGECEAIIVHLMDATEMKNLELRFVHSQKMQAVGQLAGGIAHDFNNLLTAMMGFCDLLLMRHPAGDQSFADIMQIKQNANRAANLVRQLLAFSRKQTLQPEILNISDVIADLTNLVSRLIGENIDLEILYGKEVGLVKVDQGQLEQVLVNIAVNARDAMPEGGKLLIKTENVTVNSSKDIDSELVSPAEDEKIEPGEYVRVDISDTGCGVPKDKVDQIFEPFYTTKDVGAGTGLGLSTVYGIVKQTGGYIYVSSKIGQGTRFSVYFKRYTKEEESAGDNIFNESFIEEKAKVTDLTGSGTILLVEDEVPVRIFSSSALENKGYTVLEADCGEAALEIVAKHGEKIDIVISDVMMPGMNGPTMVEKIKEQFPNVKVIFISGYAENAFVDTFGEEGKFNFLPKPYSLNQLAGKVKEVMTS